MLLSLSVYGFFSQRAWSPAFRWSLNLDDDRLKAELCIERPIKLGALNTLRPTEPPV